MIINKPGTPDHIIESLIDDIVIALFSVIATMNIIPFIKCMKGDASEQVAKKLDAKLRDYIANSKQLDHVKERPCK